jgi:hypothetical protein
MRIFVTPRAGLKVRDPHRPGDGYLPAEGAWKEDSSAWRRLAKTGDVIVAKEDTMKPAARASEAKK